MNVAQLKRFCQRFPQATETLHGEPYNFLVYSAGSRKFAYFKTSEPERWRFSMRVFQGTFKTDGSYAGSFQTAQGKPGSMFGTWTVDDDGKLCQEVTNSFTGKGSSCGYYCKVGENLYFSASDAERSTRVLKRAIKQ